MSQLPPAGNPIKDGAVPVDQQFTGRDVERRSGVDRRVLESSGGRRQGPAERRKDFTPLPQPENNPESKPEPVHVVDAGGRLQPNPEAGVAGLSDIERVANAIEDGKPLASPEAGGLNIPDGGIVVPHKVDAASASRESAAQAAREAGQDVAKPADQEKVAEQQRVAEEHGLVGSSEFATASAEREHAAIEADQRKAEAGNIVGEGSQQVKAEEGGPIQGKLPEDFPSHAALAAEGVNTYAQLRKRIEAGTLTEIPGIGDVSAEKIKAALDEAERFHGKGH